MNKSLGIPPRSKKEKFLRSDDVKMSLTLWPRQIWKPYWNMGFWFCLQGTVDMTPAVLGHHLSSKCNFFLILVVPFFMLLALLMGFSGGHCHHHEFLFFDVILVTVTIFIVSIISVVRGHKSLWLHFFWFPTWLKS